jgi:hypothetical protein
MVPVNLRTEDPNGRVGNEISMLPLGLPLDIEDPAERLRVVARRSAAMKAARVADVIQLIGIGLGWTPPSLQQSLASLPFMPQCEPALIVNMVCTNVPGPMVPLYSNGRELLTYYPHVPCGSDVGISIATSSYNQNLYHGITSDAQAAPDAELFRDFLVEAYEELREAAGIRPIAATATTLKKPSKAVAPEERHADRETRATAIEPSSVLMKRAETVRPGAGTETDVAQPELSREPATFRDATVKGAPSKVDKAPCCQASQTAGRQEESPFDNRLRSRRPRYAMGLQ